MLHVATGNKRSCHSLKVSKRQPQRSPGWMYVDTKHAMRDSVAWVTRAQSITSTDNVRVNGS